MVETPIASESAFIHANCMHSPPLRRLALWIFRTSKPQEVLAVDGSVMGRLTHCTQTVTLWFLTPTLKESVSRILMLPVTRSFLGHPWLKVSMWIGAQVRSKPRVIIVYLSVSLKRRQLEQFSSQVTLNIPTSL